MLGANEEGSLYSLNFNARESSGTSLFAAFTTYLAVGPVSSVAAIAVDSTVDQSARKTSILEWEPIAIATQVEQAENWGHQKR